MVFCSELGKVVCALVDRAVLYEPQAQGFNYTKSADVDPTISRRRSIKYIIIIIIIRYGKINGD